MDQSSMKSGTNSLDHTDTQQPSEQSSLINLSSSVTSPDSTAVYAVGVLGLAVVQLLPLTMDVVTLVATPLQLSGALCEAGAGDIISAGMWILAALLVYKAIPDIYRGLDQKGQRSGKAQKQAGEYFSAAVTKCIGAVVIGSMPTILSAMGFSLLGCVDSANIFNTGVITPVWHLFL